jgi:hypothetical protein
MRLGERDVRWISRSGFDDTAASCSSLGADSTAVRREADAAELELGLGVAPHRQPVVVPIVTAVTVNSLAPAATSRLAIGVMTTMKVTGVSGCGEPINRTDRRPSVMGASLR